MLCHSNDNVAQLCCTLKLWLRIRFNTGTYQWGLCVVLAQIIFSALWQLSFR